VSASGRRERCRFNHRGPTLDVGHTRPNIGWYPELAVGELEDAVTLLRLVSGHEGRPQEDTGRECVEDEVPSLPSLRWREAAREAARQARYSRRRYPRALMARLPPLSYRRSCTCVFAPADGSGCVRTWLSRSALCSPDRLCAWRHSPPAFDYSFPPLSPLSLPPFLPLPFLPPSSRLPGTGK